MGPPCRRLPVPSRAAPERLVFYCRTTSASTAPCTSRRMCCPTYCASCCARVSRSCEHFPDGFDLHLLQAALNMPHRWSDRSALSCFGWVVAWPNLRSVRGSPISVALPTFSIPSGHRFIASSLRRILELRAVPVRHSSQFRNNHST